MKLVIIKSRQICGKCKCKEKMIKFIYKRFTKISFYYLSKGLDKLCQEDSEAQKCLAIIPNGTK